ncbi:MAG TPA: ion channel [Phycicoccus sp.]|nr:ion channel [Phycicoccus sp.]
MTMPWEDLDERLSRRTRWGAIIRKQPSALLLAIQLLAILILPWLEESESGHVVIFIVSFFAVLFAVATVRRTPAVNWLSGFLAVPAILLEVTSVVTGNQLIATIAYFALAAFYLYVAYGLIAYMFEDSWVTKDELFAVAAAFTVLLFSFAYLYLGVQGLSPNSFAGAGDGPKSFLELIYFSGANLTGCGLSDIIAVGGHARAICTIEQLAGVLYVAMVISRLVALTAMRNK